MKSVIASRWPGDCRSRRPIFRSRRMPLACGWATAHAARPRSRWPSGTTRRSPTRFAGPGNSPGLRGTEPAEHTCTVAMTRTGRNDTSFQGRLRKLGLLRNKHIPALYLRAGRGQRLELLQGLLDTDGHVSRSGECEIIIKSCRLADDFGELLSSLGFKYGRSRKFTMLEGRRLGPYHRFHFTIHSHIPAFRLKRKQARLRPARRRARCRSPDTSWPSNRQNRSRSAAFRSIRRRGSTLPGVAWCRRTTPSCARRPCCGRR